MLLSLCLIWEAASRLRIVDPVLLPPLSRVVQRALRLLLSGRLIVQACASLARVFMGFLLAAGVALPAGVFLGLNAAAESYVNLTLQVLRPLSPPAWIPLAILWFGIGNAPAVFIIFIGTVFTLLIGMTAATQALDRRLMWAGFTLGATRGQVLRFVILPALLPAILTQLRVGLGLAWMSVIAAEMVAVRFGLGYMMIEGRNLFRVEDVLVGMATVGVLGQALDAILRWVESRLLRWRRGTNAGELFYRGVES
jgi:ABC-type nitrate/sulfonate/bicarbonate transport system permease component